MSLLSLPVHFSFDALADSMQLLSLAPPSQNLTDKTSKSVSKQSARPLDLRHLIAYIGQFYCSTGVEFHTFCRINKTCHALIGELFHNNSRLMETLCTQSLGSKIFGSMPNSLFNLMQVKGETIESFTIGYKIRHSFTRVRELQEYDCRAIASSFINLQQLTLRACRLTPESFQQLNLLPLRELSFIGTSVERLLEKIGAISTLQTLLFNDVKLPEDALKKLLPLKNLTSLSLISITNGIRAIGLKHLQHFPKLGRLDLTASNSRDQELATISNIQKLDSLNLSRCVQFSGAGLSLLAPCKRLHELDLSSTNVTDFGGFLLTELLRRHTLTTLKLGDCQKITDLSVTQLTDLSGLRELTLENTKLTDKGVQALDRATFLTKLSLCGVKVTEEGLAAIAHLPLETLHLGNTQISEKALPLLARMQTLTELYLNDLRFSIRDEHTVHFIQLQKLQKLSLTNYIGTPPRITDVGLLALATLTKLSVLEINYSGCIPLDRKRELVKRLPYVKFQ
jgi:hypothetical protein